MDYEEIGTAQLTELLFQHQLKQQRWSRDLNQGIEIQLSNGLKLLVRWMRYRDVPIVCDIERQIFPSPWTADSFLYELHNRDYNISLVGLIDKKIVTYAVSYVVYDEFHISNVAVTADFRRLKIGETMLKITLQVGMEKACQTAHLEVRRSNLAALALYQKYGFEIAGMRKNYYQNDNEDALLMTQKLVTENIDGVV